MTVTVETCRPAIVNGGLPSPEAAQLVPIPATATAICRNRTAEVARIMDTTNIDRIEATYI